MDKKDHIVARQITLVVVGFLLTFSILGVAVKVVLKNQEDNYIKLDYLVNQSNAKSEKMTQLSDSIRDRMLIVYDILISDDAFEIDEMNMLFSSKATDFIKARNHLMSLDLTDSQINELVDQRKILKQAQVTLTQIVENAINETGNNQVELISKARDVNAGVLERLNKMREMQAKLSMDELSEARTAYEDTRSQMVVLGMFGFAFSFFIVYFVIRQIRNQGKKLTALMQQLEESNQTLEERVEKRTQQLLHTRDENMRMGAELDISKQLQRVILPTPEEILEIEGLDISAFMQPADEIGGDYYEVLKHEDGALIGIGDVTGHGLESGMVMLMIQSIIRSQSNLSHRDLIAMLKIANITIHDNVSRMNSEKNLTLMLMDYNTLDEYASSKTDQAVAEITVAGQHESLIIIRNNGEIEEIDTDELGFPIGLVSDADDFFNTQKASVYKGDLLVLYTDGITEAANMAHELYGTQRLCALVQANHLLTPEEIKELVISDVKLHIGEQKIFDDLTLLVMKQL
ncbi:MAG: PP2C family protein-serine/threonine phosphatase [Gammaproteobacteria bacterium]|nr:PP2C family protein-serine/threonine phosphatase [Gammaproteobacteria bacterium]